MKPLLIAVGLALLLSSGCAGKVTRIEFSCVTVPSAESVVTNCADPTTWAEWLKSQRGEI